MSSKTAFVLMPFDEEFNDVYKHLIHDCLLSAGYTVKRADDIKVSQEAWAGLKCL
jgi:hypothetical protein